MRKSKDLAPLKSSFKIIIFNSTKIKPPSNASKARQTITAGTLKKREPSQKHLKNKSKSRADVHKLYQKLAM